VIIQQLDSGQPGVHQTPENRGFLKNPRRSGAASSGTSPATSTAPWPPPCPPQSSPT